MAKGGLKDITVIVDNAGERRAAKVAAELARVSEAHLTGIALAVDPLVPVYTVAAPIPTDFIVAAHEQGVEEAKAALAAFDAIGSAAGVTTESRLAESISGDFSSVIRNAILTDLVVVGQDDPDHAAALRAALIEALLFQAGLPTLLVPYSGAREFHADKAVIAWNGSAQAARAVRAAMPLLAMSKSVLVAIVDEGAPPAGRRRRAPTSAPISPATASRSRCGPSPTPMRAPARRSSISPSTRRRRWLVMGAYGHSRIRQFLLGGVTRSILGNATIPVLMAH